ncbi:MAG: EamA family transporter [bacterium]|nr:EamA family transporter [bacterium]
MITWWFIHSIIALIAFGCTQAFLKVPATKGYNKYTYSVIGSFTASLLCTLFFFDDISFDVRTILYTSLWGIGYTAYLLFQMQILKKLDTSESFPITSLGSLILVVIIGVVFFKDILSVLQVCGIIFTIIVIGFYNHSKKHITFSNGLIPIALSIILLSASTKFLQKYGAITTELNNFIFWQLFFAFVASVFFFFLSRKSDLLPKKWDSQIIIWAILLGVFNFIGTAEVMKALSVGPFSLVYTIVSFYILVSSIIAWKFFGEKLTRHKIIFIVFGIGTILLIRFG